MARETVFSTCGKHRYALTEYWGCSPFEEANMALWVMLNPSVADQDRDDPTVRKVRGFTERLRPEQPLQGFTIVNLWSFIATDPRDLRKASREDKEDVRNGFALRLHLTRPYAYKIAAWGTNGKGKATELTRYDRGLLVLGRNRDGSPRHPLMAPYKLVNELTPLVKRL